VSVRLATVAGVSTRSGAELDALIEEATVDTYDEIEAVNGFLAAIDEHLAVPFSTTVLGVEVTVVGIDVTNDFRCPSAVWPLHTSRTSTRCSADSCGSPDSPGASTATPCCADANPGTTRTSRARESP
jgi:hypothetical protein